MHAFDDGLADGALALFVTFYADFQRRVEDDQGGGNLAFPGQVEKFLARRDGQRGGVHHAQPIHRKPLFYKEMQQCKGLDVKALVAFVVANEGARPIRRDNLRRPEVPLSKGGFPASRRAA
jgi:hypothetical protein